MPSTRAAFDRATLAFVIVLLALTGARVAALFYNPITLDFDEAQYWMWSRTLEWGYFTKPPMIAWVIGATTAVFGDAEWAVRLGAPLAHAVAAGAIFSLARAMYGSWPGFWAGLGWLLLPGVFFSSGIISTDAILLPLWAMALYAMWRLVETRSWGWAILLGVFFGAGVLAKYAMLYFAICTALAAWKIPPVREALGRGRGVVAGLIGVALIAPNVWWNVQNGFATARHTAANASLNLDDMFHVDELFEFLGLQGAVIGPLILFALVWALWRAVRRRSGLSIEDKFLISYIVPPLVFVSIIAFVSRANANWAAVSYPAILVWVTGSLFTSVAGRRWLAGANVVNAGIGIAMILIVMLAPQIANQAKAVRNAQDWDQTAHQIALWAVARPGEPPFTAVMVDDRQTYFELNYHWRHLRRAGAPLPPVRMWLKHGQAYNSAEASDPMRAEEGARVLVVHKNLDDLTLVSDDFTLFRTVEHLTTPLRGGAIRELELSIGEGFAPEKRDAAFEEMLTRRSED